MFHGTRQCSDYACVAGHDVRKTAAPQKQTWGQLQRSPVPMRNSGDAGASGNGGPGTNGIRDCQSPDSDALRI